MWRDLVFLFFPKFCFACDQTLHQNEKTICTSCRHHLPLGKFQRDNANKLQKVFDGKIRLINFDALLRYEKEGLVQNLIHNLKYRGHQEIGTCLGSWLGENLKNKSSYNSVSIVIPVPLHKKRFRERGYNQVAKFGAEIAQSLQINYREDLLIKVKNTEKQAKKKRINRHEDSKQSFKCQNKEALAKKHVLLVDDVMTTGATLEACIQAFVGIDGLELSIVTMAITA